MVWPSPITYWLAANFEFEFIIFIQFYTVKPVFIDYHWDPKKVAVVWRWSLFWVSPLTFLFIWGAWWSGYLLLTGGRCLEVVVSTGLTVFGKKCFTIYFKCYRFCLLKLKFCALSSHSNINFIRSACPDDLLLVLISSIQ